MIGRMAWRVSCASGGRDGALGEVGFEEGAGVFEAEGLSVAVAEALEEAHLSRGGELEAAAGEESVEEQGRIVRRAFSWRGEAGSPCHSMTGT